MSSPDPYEEYFTNLSDEPPVLEAGAKASSGKRPSMRGGKKSMRGGKKSMRGGKKVSLKLSGGKRRKMNAYFKAMIAARKKGAESFEYNGQTYYKRMHSIHPNAPPQPLYSKKTHSTSSSHRRKRRRSKK